MLSKPEYEQEIARTRDERMEWWREARFGMFIHYGLYSQLGRNEWVMACENIPVKEYEKLADTFASLKKAAAANGRRLRKKPDANIWCSLPAITRASAFGILK